MADKSTQAAVRAAEEIKNLEEWQGEGPEINQLALLIDQQYKELVEALHDLWTVCQEGTNKGRPIDIMRISDFKRVSAKVEAVLSAVKGSDDGEKTKL